MAYWKKVVFTGESEIKICGSDGRIFVQRKTKKEWLPCCTFAEVKTGRRDLNFGVGLNVLQWSESTDHC